jgi:hypothetical protein
VLSYADTSCAYYSNDQEYFNGLLKSAEKMGSTLMAVIDEKFPGVKLESPKEGGAA